MLIGWFLADPPFAQAPAPNEPLITASGAALNDSGGIMGIAGVATAIAIRGGPTGIVSAILIAGIAVLVGRKDDITWILDEYGVGNIPAIRRRVHEKMGKLQRNPRGLDPDDIRDIIETEFPNLVPKTDPLGPLPRDPNQA
jgi:hypothetical protein